MFISQEFVNQLSSLCPRSSFRLQILPGYTPYSQYEAKVGDFLCHPEKGENKGEFKSLNQLKKDLKRDVICIFTSTVRLKLCRSVVPR